LSEYSMKKYFRKYSGIPAGECLKKVLEKKPKTILDVGSGTGEHAKIFRENGSLVTTISMIEPADLVCDFLKLELERYECVWVSHVLEHVLNVQQFLLHCKKHLKTSGFLAITVPPLKTELVGGHINLFTPATFCYQLILAGFKIENLGMYGYNISAICSIREHNQKLIFDSEDIETLSEYFPQKVFQKCSGFFKEKNWH
jgi:ubiquinone/menaquinone biosynthesis C-methylase UbiE